MAERNDTAEALPRIRIVNHRRHSVRYVGAQEDLIAAGIASAEMFPPPGRQRMSIRYNWRNEHVSTLNPRFWRVSRQHDGLFAVTRCKTWRERAQREAPAPTGLDFNAMLTGVAFDEIAYVAETRIDEIEAECTALERLAAEDDEVDGEDVREAVTRIRGALSSLSLLVRYDPSRD
ncbi:MAG: hypothetical protein AB7P16_28440 [Bradyrhizobium sp.]|uniref:hypothetical protein n=1 Tax=Bradyrhizobium sp. TaxID=376 RepID=UPI003D0A30CF